MTPGDFGAPSIGEDDESYFWKVQYPRQAVEPRIDLIMKGVGIQMVFGSKSDVGWFTGPTPSSPA